MKIEEIFIEDMLSKAQEQLSKGRDYKRWINPSDLTILIRAGAVVMREEYQGSDSQWVTEVSFGGFNFLAFSGAKLTSGFQKR